MNGYSNFKACIRLEIEIENELDFDQSKQSLLNLKLDFFVLIKFQSNLNFNFWYELKTASAVNDWRIRAIAVRFEVSECRKIHIIEHA